MQEIFEKIIEKLEELKNHYNECCLVDYNEGAAVGLTEAMNIVRQAAAEDNNGWIPCSERLPDTDDSGYAYVMVSMDDEFIATTDYVKGEGFSLWAESGEVIAWQPLPQPYEPKEG